MPAYRSIVVILSNDPAFAREIATNWPSDANAPEFTVLEGSLFRDLIGSQYDLAIADASLPKGESDLKQALYSASKPAILVYSRMPEKPTRVSESERGSRAASQGGGAIIELHRTEAREEQGSRKGQSWATVAGLIGREILRRTRAETRGREAEALSAAVQTEAMLGRFMIEMRHNMNNALTSVLGNAELLTLEPGLPANAIAQADTIRNMALRMHEIFQRFSSIEKELFVVARESDKKIALARGAGVS